MEEETFEESNLAVKIAAKKVENEVNLYLAENLTASDISIFNDRLKYIQEKLGIFNDLFTNLVCHLDSTNAVDQSRIEGLEIHQENLVELVVNNEIQVKEKIQQLLGVQPMSKADQEILELKRKQMVADEEKEKAARA